MRSKLGLPARLSCWVLLLLAVVGHAALAVLAVAEFATMGWPLPTWFDTGAVTLVLATAAVGLAASTLVAVRAVAGARALRALIRARIEPGRQRPAHGRELGHRQHRQGGVAQDRKGQQHPA